MSLSLIPAPMIMYLPRVSHQSVPQDWTTPHAAHAPEEDSQRSTDTVRGTSTEEKTGSNRSSDTDHLKMPGLEVPVLERARSAVAKGRSRGSLRVCSPVDGPIRTVGRESLDDDLALRSLLDFFRADVSAELRNNDETTDRPSRSAVAGSPSWRRAKMNGGRRESGKDLTKRERPRGKWEEEQLLWRGRRRCDEPILVRYRGLQPADPVIFLPLLRCGIPGYRKDAQSVRAGQVLIILTQRRGPA